MLLKCAEEVQQIKAEMSNRNFLLDIKSRRNERQKNLKDEKVSNSIFIALSSITNKCLCRRETMPLCLYKRLIADGWRGRNSKRKFCMIAQIVIIRKLY